MVKNGYAPVQYKQCIKNYICVLLISGNTGKSTLSNCL